MDFIPQFLAAELVTTVLMWFLWFLQYHCCSYIQHTQNYIDTHTHTHII